MFYSIIYSYLISVRRKRYVVGTHKPTEHGVENLAGDRVTLTGITQHVAGNLQINKGRTHKKGMVLMQTNMGKNGPQR
jgi:hypothetical protein